MSAPQMPHQRFEITLASTYSRLWYEMHLQATVQTVSMMVDTHEAGRRARKERITTGNGSVIEGDLVWQGSHIRNQKEEEILRLSMRERMKIESLVVNACAYGFEEMKIQLGRSQ